MVKTSEPRLDGSPGMDHLSAEFMSTNEIIAELPRLSRPELEQVDAKLHELLQHKQQSSAQNWGDALSSLAGTVEGLPADCAINHDHYLHGAPKR